MSFQNPLWLLGLLVVPALAGLYLLMQGRRRAYAVRFTNLELLRSVVPHPPRFRRHLPPILFLLGIAGLLLAAAGPILNLEVARNQADVILVIDVSGSMQATDVQPSRLDAATTAARSLITALPVNARVGLVKFNERADLVAPLTDNRSDVTAALDTLRPGGGTAIGDGINLAVQQLGRRSAASAARQSPAMIVLLTDGSSNAGVDPLVAAQSAKAGGIPIDTIGVGQRGATTYVRGQQVDGVDEAVLQNIATTTGGKYYYAQAAGQLNKIYQRLGSEFAWQFLRVDITVATMIAGAVVLLLGGLLSLRWFRVFP